MPQLPQDEMIVSDKEERTDAAPKSEQMDNRTSSSKAPLSRYHENIFNKCCALCLNKYNLYRTDIYIYIYIKIRSSTKDGV